MKQRVTLLLIALMMTMSVPALAADMKIGGEFEAAGVCQRNFDFDKDADDHTRTWAGTLVLSLEAPVTENISIFATYTLVDGMWGDAANGDPAGLYNTSGMVSDDVAYAVVGLDSFTVTVGRQLDEWGNMLMAGGDGVDRFKVSTMWGGMEHALFTDKVLERDQGDLKDDTNRYGLQVNRAGEEDQGFGLYLWHAMGNGVVSAGAVNTVDDLSGYGVDIYYRGAVGPVSLTAELAYQGGDAEVEDLLIIDGPGWGYGNDAYDKSRMGLFVTAEMDMEPMILSGTIAYAKNNFVAGPYFNPTFMTGTDQDNAHPDFGDFGGYLGSSTHEGDSAMLIALGIDYAVTDNWTLGAKVAQHTFADDEGLEGTEVDLMAEYQISEGATWGLYVAQLSPDGFEKATAAGVTGIQAKDDSAMSVVQSLFIEF